MQLFLPPRECVINTHLMPNTAKKTYYCVLLNLYSDDRAIYIFVGINTLQFILT